MSHPLLIVSQSDYLIQVVDTNSHFCVACIVWQTHRDHVAHPSTSGSALALCRRHTFQFHSITFEGMRWLLSESAEGYIIVKYKSSSILVIICQTLAELWPFLNLVFMVGLRCWFPFKKLWRGAFISSEVCRQVCHCRIQAKFDIGNYRQNFGRVMALFRLSFCCWVNYVDTSLCAP